MNPLSPARTLAVMAAVLAVTLIGGALARLF